MAGLLSVTRSMDELWGPLEKPTSSELFQYSRPLMGAVEKAEHGRPPAGMTALHDDVHKQAGCVAPPTRVRMLPYESPQYSCELSVSYVVAVTGGSRAAVPAPSVPYAMDVVRLPVAELPHSQSVVSELQLTLRMRLADVSPSQPLLPVLGSISSAVIVLWKVESSPVPFAQPMAPLLTVRFFGVPPPTTTYMSPVT